MAGDKPVVTYRQINRYSKQFEPIFGDFIKEGFFKIPALEIKGLGYGDAEEVPEGIAVKLAVPGTAKTKGGQYIVYEEGDLEICDVDDAEVYGFTLQKIVPVGTNFPYLRKQFQTSVFRGEYVGVCTGHFVAIVQGWHAETGIGSTTPAIKDSLFVGNKGMLSLDGENGVSSGSNAVATIIALDRIQFDFATGAAKAGETHKELTIKCKVL